MASCSMLCGPRSDGWIPQNAQKRRKKRDVGNPSPRSRWLVKQTNSPSHGSGVTSPAAGMRHLPARRIPASSKDARRALVHLDLPHGSVEGAIVEKVCGGRRIWDRLDRDAEENGGARNRRK